MPGRGTRRASGTGESERRLRPKRALGDEGDHELAHRVAANESCDRYLDDILERLQRLEANSVTGGTARVSALEQAVTFDARLGEAEAKLWVLQADPWQGVDEGGPQGAPEGTMSQKGAKAKKGTTKGAEATKGARVGADPSPQGQRQESIPEATEPLRASAGTGRSQAPAADPSNSSSSSSSSSDADAPKEPPHVSHKQRQTHTSGGALSIGGAQSVGQHPGVWAELGALLPRQPRALHDYPHLAAPGNTPQGGQAYMRWHTATYAKFRVASERAFGIVYACQRACAGIPLFVNEVMKVGRLPDYGLRAWLAARDHSVKRASCNRTLLQNELHNLKPRDGESMDGFLARRATLRTKFPLYNLVLEDQDLIVQLNRGLSHSWRTAVRQFHQGRDPEDLPWSVLQMDLRKIDTERRQSCLTAPAALPLGVTPEEHRQGQGGQAPGQAAQSHAAGGGKGAKPKQGGESGGSHVVSDCTTRPADWRLTTALKAAAEKIRDATITQAKANRTVRQAIASTARVREAESETASTSQGVASRGGASSSEADPGSGATQARTL